MRRSRSLRQPHAGRLAAADVETAGEIGYDGMGSTVPAFDEHCSDRNRIQCDRTACSSFCDVRIRTTLARVQVNVLYVYQYEFDSGGRFFVAAINQLFAGFYVMEVCLIGIFILAIGPDGGSACIPQALAMMAVLLLTVAFQAYLNRTYRAMMFYLPVSWEEQAPLVRQSKSIALSTGTGKPDTAGEGQGLHVPSLTMTRARMAGVSGEETSSTEVSVCRPAFHEQQADSESQDDDDLAAKLRAQELAPTIWIPKDTLGVIKGELDAAVLTVPSVNVSDDGAFMDDGGNVTIETCPPKQGSLSYVKPESNCARNHVA